MHVSVIGPTMDTPAPAKRGLPYADPQIPQRPQMVIMRWIKEANRCHNGNSGLCEISEFPVTHVLHEGFTVTQATRLYWGDVATTTNPHTPKRHCGWFEPADNLGNPIGGCRDPRGRRCGPFYLAG